MTAAELIESLDRHFMAGCPSLSTSQLAEHEATGACRECSWRAQWAAMAHMHQQRDVQIQQEVNRLRPLALGSHEGEQ